MQPDANCGLQPAAAARQKSAFDDRFDFEKAERETGLARPVKPWSSNVPLRYYVNAEP